jgi:hypothetical protein
MFDYASLGIGRECVTDLIRMATDEALDNAPSESPEVWGPIHARRALAELRAEVAIGPLLGLLPRIDGEMDTWISEDLPRVLAAIGPAAIRPAADFLADDTRGEWSRILAASVLSEIAMVWPDWRDTCVDELVTQLTRFDNLPVTVNSHIISSLLDLHAVEAAPIIEQAFAAGRVDEVVQGDWEDVQIELGLKTSRDHPRKPNDFTRMGDRLQEGMGLKLDENGRALPLDPPQPGTTRSTPLVLPPGEQVFAPDKVGRNDPCPCGSGKKFKKCCG